MPGSERRQEPDEDASWYEVHPYLSALGAGAAMLVVGTIVVVAVGALRRR